MFKYLVLINAIFTGIYSCQDHSSCHKELLQDLVAKILQSNQSDEISQLRTNDIKRDLRGKRILMQSDRGPTDIANEINKLKEELSMLRQSFDSLKLNGTGTVYVRWGKSECSNHSSTIRVYKGYMGGKKNIEKGSGTNHLCLPDDPTWGTYQAGAQYDRAYVFGAEFNEPDRVVFGKAVMGQNIPCAVCKVPSISIMIPARVDCYPGWKLEYTGYLMAGFSGQYADEYICMDVDPEFINGGARSTYGHLPYLVESVCGTLSCPPYYNYRELACAVCSL